MPPEGQAGPWIRPNVLGLSAGGPITVDDEAGGIEFFQVHVAAGDGAGRQVGRRKADRFGLVHPGFLSVSEPCVELGEGGRGELVALQNPLCILVGLRRCLVARRCN